MGGVISNEEAHYRGPIKSGDKVIISGYNMAHLDNEMTHIPYYLYCSDELVWSIELKTYEENIRPIVFDVIFPVEYPRYFCLKIDKTIPQYLGINRESGRAMLTSEVSLLQILPIPNTNQPTSWSPNVLLSDVGYMVQERSSNGIIDWSYHGNYHFRHVRFIPLHGYYRMNGICYPICNGIEFNECVDKTLDNDKRWMRNVYNKEGDVDYMRIYTEQNDCLDDIWYNYCAEPQQCGQMCRGPCGIGANCVYDKAGYYCLTQQKTSNPVLMLDTKKSKSWLFVVLVIFIISMIILCIVMRAS